MQLRLRIWRSADAPKETPKGPFPVQATQTSNGHIASGDVRGPIGNGDTLKVNHLTSANAKARLVNAMNGIELLDQFAVTKRWCRRRAVARPTARPNSTA